tara:strand:- start:103 stop:540 length:438 start_codon:yes stop_codon:yes gene_type:complete
MKTFKQHISESGVKTAAAVGTTVDGQSVEDSQIGAHNIQDEDVLKVVNGFVESICCKEYLNPQHAVDELIEKLARVGLHMDCQLEGDKGTQTCDVMRHGGRFGKDTDGSDINDDGISHQKEGGLKLEVKHERLETGSSKVYAKLV